MSNFLSNFTALYVISPIFGVLTTIVPEIAYGDYARPWQLSFQLPATEVMHGIISLHHDVMFFCTIILVFIMYLLYVVIRDNKDNNKSAENEKNRAQQAYGLFDGIHNPPLEIIWTLTPAFILILIAIPSFALLYSIDEPVDPAITLKVVGHQWYWTYEYSDYQTKNGDSIVFDSYMIANDDIRPGKDIRLLEVDNRIVLPINTHIRVIVTAADVLHSWAVPAFGAKTDACPGRLNQIFMYIKKEGVFFGQCSEICGVNHGFMPICVEAVSLDNYEKWISSKLASI